MSESAETNRKYYFDKEEICWNCDNLTEDHRWLFCILHLKRVRGLSRSFSPQSIEKLMHIYKLTTELWPELIA